MSEIIYVTDLQMNKMNSTPIEPDQEKNSRIESGYYQALKRKLFFRAVIMALTPMILVSAIILFQFDKSYIDKVNAHLKELILKHKQNINHFLDEKLNNIHLLSSSFSFDELSDESFLQNKLDLLRREYHSVFVDLGVIDDKGIQIAYCGPFKFVKADYSESYWFKNAIKNKYFISDVFLGLRGQPHFIIAVRNTWHNKYWILRATIDFAAFNSLVENLSLGKTGFAFILNKSGKPQTRPRFDITPCKECYMDLLKNENGKNKEINITEKKDDLGVKNIYVSAFLKNGDWLLIYQQKISDAFIELKRTHMIAFVIIVLAAIMIITSAYLLSKKVVMRIAKADRENEMMNQQVIETGKLASIGELASGIAHEINNPVAIMVEEAGWIGDLLEEEEFRESENLDEFNRAILQIKSQGKRCKEITYKLLSFARKTDSRVQPLQMNDLINELVELSRQRAKYNNVGIEVSLDNNLPFIQASQTEMQQVLLNLINNAIDAMGNEGGKLSITSSCDSDKITIDVADDGPGIPRAILGRIFDPFFTTKQVGKGTGLGLSICYGIIKKMGGDINVKSVGDLGTTFSIRIPFIETVGNGTEPETEDKFRNVNN